MEPDFDRFLPQPDLDENHFPECGAQHGDGICDCNDIERSMRGMFAEMKADYARENY